MESFLDVDKSRSKASGIGDDHAFPRDLLITAMDQHPRRERLRKSFREPAESVEETAADRGAGLDLDPDLAICKRENKIHFVARAVPIKMQITAAAAIVTMLERLDHDEVLEQRAFERVGEYLFLVLNSQQICREADIEEIQLG